MKCIHCGSPTRMQVQATISAPGELAHQFSKTNLRRKDVHLIGVQWETADFICTNPECQRVTDGYGNYVSNLKKENERLARAWEAMQKEKTKAVTEQRKLWSALRKANARIRELKGQPKERSGREVSVGEL